MVPGSRLAGDNVLSRFACAFAFFFFRKSSEAAGKYSVERTKYPKRGKDNTDHNPSHTSLRRTNRKTKIYRTIEFCHSFCLHPIFCLVYSIGIAPVKSSDY
jgi:hypothetical protein